MFIRLCCVTWPTRNQENITTDYSNNNTKGFTLPVRLDGKLFRSRSSHDGNTFNNCRSSISSWVFKLLAWENGWRQHNKAITATTLAYLSMMTDSPHTMPEISRYNPPSLPRRKQHTHTQMEYKHLRRWLHNLEDVCQRIKMEKVHRQKGNFYLLLVDQWARTCLRVRQSHRRRTTLPFEDDQYLSCPHISEATAAAEYGRVERRRRLHDRLPAGSIVFHTCPQCVGWRLIWRQTLWIKKMSNHILLVVSHKGSRHRIYDCLPTRFRWHLVCNAIWYFINYFV